MRIYLAGGMRTRGISTFTRALKALKECRPHEASGFVGLAETSWVSLVRAALPFGHMIFYPRSSNIKIFEDYSFLDLMELRRCDLVIAYLEFENPSGLGLASEIAYAKGLGKTVLLINEQRADETTTRYVKFIENFADRVFHTLEDAIPLISRIQL